MKKVIRLLSVAVISIIVLLSAGIIYVLNIKSPTPKDKQFDFVNDHGVPFAQSPAQVLDKALDEGRLKPNEVLANQDWPYPSAIDAYPEKFDSKKGEAVKIYYSGGLLLEDQFVKKYTLYDAYSNEVLYEYKFTSGEHPLERKVCQSFYGKGCEYEQFIEIDPQYVPIGQYYVKLEGDGGQKSLNVYFSVREKDIDNSSPKVVVMFPDITWQAYNTRGGGSIYAYYLSTWTPECQFVDKEIMTDIRVLNNHLGGIAPLDFIIEKFNTNCKYYVRYDYKDRLSSVNMQRSIFYVPTSSNNFIHSPAASLVFLSSLKKHGISYRTFSNEDLHLDNSLLNKANILVIGGHHEYWTGRMRRAVDDFISRGGHVINFSGNLSWTKVNYVDGVLYNNFQMDHEFIYQLRKENGEIEDHLLKIKSSLPKIFQDSSMWRYMDTQHPTQDSFGLTYEFGGYALKEFYTEGSAIEKFKISKEIYRKSSSIEIMEPDHPIFADTDLEEGDLWGDGLKLISDEMDGVPLDGDNKIHPRYRKKFSGEIKTLGSAYLLNESNIYSYEISKSGEFKSDISRRNVEKSAIIIEFKKDSSSGTVISVGTMGYAKALKRNDPIAEKIFINSIHYLNNLQK
jgi:hypothetical protein